ncbi:MAG: glycosyltransferase family 39 protein [Candidatus Liptonbacteria bacterium]|nr:glycosyltransferase family 39 protein [Candidatus Liptonbacteria bacterium]
MTFSRFTLPYYILGFLLAAALGLLLWGAFTDALIVDEQAHIPAGYAYLYRLDYRLNPEHPPLLKALSAFPLGFLRPAFPDDRPSWQEEINSQWTVGDEFLFQVGNDANLLIPLSRLGSILLTLLAIFFLYRLGRENLGSWWALIPAALFALSPTILGHGHYVTTDVAAAFGVILATFYFLRFLKAPSQDRLFAASVALGIALLIKFSTVFLLPYFFLLSLFSAWIASPTWSRALLTAVKNRVGPTLLITFAAYAFVVYPVYAVFTLRYPEARQQADTAYLLSSFEGGPPAAGTICKPMRCIAEATIAATKNPFTRPLAQYSLGLLMVMQREGGTNTNYFLGGVSSSGTPLYFPLVFALKEPLPSFLFVLAALVGILFLFFRNLPYWRRFHKFAANNFEVCAFLLFAGIYLGWSLRSNLNIGLRHIIPALPFIYLAAAWIWRQWLEGGLISARNAPESFSRTSHATLQWTFALFLGMWLITETALAGPYFLSYFNQIAGGTWNGYRYVTDSNYDWGQDWLRLQAWIQKRNSDNDPGNNIEKIAIDHFGGGNPRYYLGERAVVWASSKGTPTTEEIRWLAVSVNTLQSAIQPTVKGFTRNPEDEYRWLTNFRPPKPGMGNIPTPDFRVGTSIFVYKL